MAAKELIATVTLASGAGSLTFSSIPQTYTDLLLVLSARTGEGGAYFSYMSFRPNSAITGMSGRRLAGNGSAASAGVNSYMEFGVNGNATPANTFSNTSFYITNYAGSTSKPVSIDMTLENNVTEAYIRIIAGQYPSSSAITSIELNAEGQSLVAGTTASLYGFNKGSDGTTTVS